MNKADKREAAGAFLGEKERRPHSPVRGPGSCIQFK